MSYCRNCGQYNCKGHTGSSPDSVTAEDLAATIEKAYAEFIARGTRGARHSDWEAAAILEKYTVRRKP